MKKRKKKMNKKGFTLLEVLIVIIIVGVLAGLAIPVYQAQVQRSYQQEALQHLGTTREAMLRYFAQNGTFVGADIDAGSCNLDYCPNTASAGQALHFSYGLANLAAAAYDITATRNAVAGGDGASTVAVDEAGTITKTGVFA